MATTALSSSQASASLGGDSSGVSSWVTGELDERVVSKAALDAAEDGLESLCAIHAGTFVAVEKRGQAMEQALLELQSSIENAKKKVAVAQEKVWYAQSEESKVAKGNKEQKEERTHEPNIQDGASLAVLSEKHRERRRTLLQHSALLELLELPSLMDACVRSNLYEDALSIASLANSFERRPNENKVVTHVVTQIRGRQEDLRRHLLHRLEGSVTMPECLEVVTALRRLNSIDLESRQTDTEHLYQSLEVKLQIDFLEARNVWLDASPVSSTGGGGARNMGATTAAATTPGSSEDLLDMIERYRTRVFEIATQFNAIFRANQMTATRTSSTDALAQASKTLASSADLLSLWTCRRIHAFLQLLQRGISNAAAKTDMAAVAASAAGQMATVSSQQFGAATLRDLLEATLFFSSSMGRLGADFTAHLIPNIFEDALIDWVVEHCWVQQGVKPFQEVLQICNQVNTATPLVASSAAASSVRASGSSIVWSNPSAEEVTQLFQGFSVPSNADLLLENPIPPLRVLMQVPPLGRFVNAILFGLNELRRCLLPSAFPRLEDALNSEVIQVVAKELKQLERELITMPTGKDKILREIIASEYIPIWNSIVIPYCRGSFWTAIGRAEQAMSEYTSLQNAVQGLIDEKEKAEAALIEKQNQEIKALDPGQDENADSDDVDGHKNDDEEALEDNVDGDEGDDDVNLVDEERVS